MNVLPFNFGIPSLTGPFFTADEQAGRAYGLSLGVRGSDAVLDGNGLDLMAAWTDADGQPAVPDSVQYQVFDVLKREAVSPVVAADVTGDEMEINIPGSNLPGSRSNRRRLVVQVLGTFADGVRYGQVPVYVKQRFNFL